MARCLTAPPDGEAQERRMVFDCIELSIPARAGLLQLVRLTAGVVAARAELGLDEVEDLRLGVEELCLSLVGPSGDAPGRLVLRYEWDDETIEITCTLKTGDPEDAPGPGRENLALGVSGPEADRPDERVRRDLSSQILDALVDEHGTTHGEEGPGAWLRMQRIRLGDT